MIARTAATHLDPVPRHEPHQATGSGDPSEGVRHVDRDNPRPAVGGLRPNGFAPIAAYGAIGDGRAAALVAADGAIDWLCLPDLSGGAVFWSLLDPDRGGSWTLAPKAPHTSRQRYVPDTNVLETTFTHRRRRGDGDRRLHAAGGPAAAVG